MSVRAPHLARSTLGLLAVLAVAFAAAWVFHGNGCNQSSHYSLVRALSEGVPWVDAYRDDTCDVSYIDGHYYSNKAPGLPLATLPLYASLKAVGAEPSDADSAAWILGLIGTVLPAALLLLLVRSAAETLVPGYGTAAAITLGVGTMLLPFATVFYSHVLSATLGFAAFFVLLRERAGTPRLRLVAAGGLLAGLAVVVEFPLAFLAPILAVYALVRRPRATRAAAYGLGFAVGATPLLAFNTWAFGSPFQLAYSSIAKVRPGAGDSSVPVEEPPGLFGFTMPSGDRLVNMIVGERGLLTLTPVLALGVLGAVLLFRAGRRAECAVAVAACAVYVVAISAFWGVEQSGGDPGPRYLFPMLPFLALLLAPAFRALPVTTASLAVVSGIVMSAATLTEPLINDVDPLRFWFSSLADHDVVNSVLDFAGFGRSTEALAPAALLLLAAAILAAASTAQSRIRGPDVALAIVGVAAFAYGHGLIGVALFAVLAAVAALLGSATSGRTLSLRGSLRSRRATSPRG